MRFWRAVRLGASSERGELSNPRQAQIQPWLGATAKNWTNEINNAHMNGIVATAVSGVVSKVSQSSPMAKSGERDRPDAARLLSQIFPRASPEGDFWAVTATYLLIFGMSYGVAERDQTGQFIRFVPFAPIRVRLDVRGGVQVYRVRPYGGDQTERVVQSADVLVFRYGVASPDDPSRSISPLMAEIRSVVADNEVANFIATIFSDMGIPGHIISPKEALASRGDVRSVLDILSEKLRSYTRDRRGQVLPLTQPVDIHAMGLPPSAMEIPSVGQMSIDRICAAIGVDPMAVSLPSVSKTFSNYEQSRKAMIEDVVLPIWAAMLGVAGAWLASMRLAENVEFHADKSSYIELDIGRHEKNEDARKSFEKNLLTRGEARQVLGMETELEDPRLAAEIMPEKPKSDEKRSRMSALERLHELDNLDL